MDDDRYAELRGRMDAAETVLGMLLSHAGLTEEAAEALKAEIQRYATGLRDMARDNPLTLAQCDAMDGYAMRVRSR